MTTEHDMLNTRRPAAIIRAAATLGVVLALALLLAGCVSPERLHPPRVLTSPYPPSGGNFLWAVTPLANESGTSDADTLAVSDALAAEIQQTRGLDAVPVNRVIEAMRALEIERIDSPTAAVSVARALGADAVVAGTITAWDPYEPPTIGMALSLFVLRDDLREPSALSQPIDPRSLQAAATDDGAPMRAGPQTPVSSVAEHLDASNHEVLLRLQAYASGRSDADSALGWRQHAASMSLFTEFATHRLTERLLDAERIRVARRLAGAE